MVVKPYTDTQNKKHFIRTFKSNLNEQELTWHRDKENRVVIPLSGKNWKFQLDNELPIKLENKKAIYIPKNTYHRLLMGESDLKVAIIETDRVLTEEYIENLQNNIETKRKSRSNSVRVKYEGLSHRTGGKRIRTINFTSVDPNGSGRRWKQQIQIPDLREIIKQKKNQTLDEAIGMAVYAGNVKIACSCPDFKNRYEWMADTGDYGIKKQDIPPNKTNPNLEGSTCKHIGAVFNEIENEIPNISKDLKEYLKRRRK